MAIDIPPELQWISYLAGAKWPTGNEDTMYRMAGEWRDSADQLTGLIPELDRVRAETMSVITGETAEAAKDEFAKLFDGEYSVAKLSEALSGLGDAVEKFGNDIESSKIEILFGLAMGAAEILFAIAMSYFTGGISLGSIPAIEAITMAVIRQIIAALFRAIARGLAEAVTKTTLKSLIKHGAFEAVEEVLEEGLLNIAIQEKQIHDGHKKDGFDFEDFGKAVGAAAAGGAAAGLTHGPAKTLLAGGAGKGKGGLGGAFSHGGAEYMAEINADIVGNLSVGGDIDAGTLFAGGATGGISGSIDGASGPPAAITGPGFDGSKAFPGGGAGAAGSSPEGGDPQKGSSDTGGSSTSPSTSSDPPPTGSGDQTKSAPSPSSGENGATQGQPQAATNGSGQAQQSHNEAAQTQQSHSDSGQHSGQTQQQHTETGQQAGQTQHSSGAQQGHSDGVQHGGPTQQAASETGQHSGQTQHSSGAQHSTSDVGQHSTQIPHSMTEGSAHHAASSPAVHGNDPHNAVANTSTDTRSAIDHHAATSWPAPSDVSAAADAPIAENVQTDSPPSHAATDPASSHPTYDGSAAISHEQNPGMGHPANVAASNNSSATNTSAATSDPEVAPASSKMVLTDSSPEEASPQTAKPPATDTRTPSPNTAPPNARQPAALSDTGTRPGESATPKTSSAGLSATASAPTPAASVSDAPPARQTTATVGDVSSARSEPSGNDTKAAPSTHLVPELTDAKAKSEDDGPAARARRLFEVSPPRLPLTPTELEERLRGVPPELPGTASRQDCGPLVNWLLNTLHGGRLRGLSSVDDSVLDRGGIAGAQDRVLAGGGFDKVTDLGALQQFLDTHTGWTAAVMTSSPDGGVGHVLAAHSTTDKTRWVDPQNAVGERVMDPTNASLPPEVHEAPTVWAAVVDPQGRVRQPGDWSTAKPNVDAVTDADLTRSFGTKRKNPGSASSSARKVPKTKTAEGKAPKEHVDDSSHQSDKSKANLPNRDATTKFNRAFENLSSANKDLRLPSPAEYMTHLEQSVAAEQPVAFVVNAITSYTELDNLEAVVESMTAGLPEDMNGKVAVVIGVNAPAEHAQDLQNKLEAAGNTLNSISCPVALVGSTYNNTEFHYGTERNQTLRSDVNRFAVAALSANGNFPYLSVQDFDTGSRTVPSGEHVFDYLDTKMKGDGLPPSRPLVISGGYRVPNNVDALKVDTQKRFDKELDKELARQTENLNSTDARAEQLREAAKKLSTEDFWADFKLAIDEDMAARDNLAETAPLLPYAPEPNLFLDGIAAIVNDGRASDAAQGESGSTHGDGDAGVDMVATPIRVAFGDKSSEFSALSKTLFQLYAQEIATSAAQEIATGADPSDALPEAGELLRHKTRTEPFLTDFADAATETDLSRLAYEFAVKGKLPQSHVDLTGVMSAVYKNKTAKKNVSVGDTRTAYPTLDTADREPAKIVHHNEKNAIPRHHQPEFRTGAAQSDEQQRLESVEVQIQGSATGKPATFSPGRDAKGGLGRRLGSSKSGQNYSPAITTPIGSTGDRRAGLDVSRPEVKAHLAMNVALSAPGRKLQREFGSLYEMTKEQAKTAENKVQQNATARIPQRLIAPRPDPRRLLPAKGGLYEAVAASLNSDQEAHPEPTYAKTTSPDPDTLRKMILEGVAKMEDDTKLKALADFQSNHKPHEPLTRAVFQPSQITLQQPKPLSEQAAIEDVKALGLKVLRPVLLSKYEHETPFHPRGSDATEIDNDGAEQPLALDQVSAAAPEPATSAVSVGDNERKQIRNADLIAAKALALVLGRRIDIDYGDTTEHINPFEDTGDSKPIPLNAAHLPDGRYRYSPVGADVEMIDADTVAETEDAPLTTGHPRGFSAPTAVSHFQGDVSDMRPRLNGSADPSPLTSTSPGWPQPMSGLAENPRDTLAGLPAARTGDQSGDRNRG